MKPTAFAIAVAALALGCGGHPDHSNHRFEDAQEWAKRWDDPSRDEWQRPAEVVALLAARPGGTVVDIGAGTGYFLPHLSRAVGPEGGAIGLDIEPDMVRYMNERAKREGLANVEARLVAPDDPGLEPRSVDGILIVNTWHHIADRAGYATRLRRALRPGARLVIVDYTLESPEGPPPSERLDATQVVRELEAAGLAARVVEESLPRQYVVVADEPSALSGAWRGRDSQGIEQTFVFRPGGTATWTIEGAGAFEIGFRFDPIAVPAQLDLHGFAAGPLAGKTLFGIVEFPDADSFRLDVEPGTEGEGDRVRPTSFTDQTVTYRRVDAGP